VRIAHILLPGASEYERKSQRIDAAALAASHEVKLTTLAELTRASADVAHVYGPRILAAADFVRFPLPYVANAGVTASRLPWRRVTAPAAIVSPLDNLPEAVEEHWFDAVPKPTAEGKTIATYDGGREGVRSMIDRATTRIHRFRDDIVWRTFDRPPSPADLAGVDAWVDPAIGESDFDGFVAEAVVAGLPVVAARTPLNYLRLEKGRTGFTPPANDPNELVHAILAALFKQESAQQKTQAAKQTRSKFRPRQRLRILTQLYETLLR
jgi:glycosyltransferase involved in cell wall biosynthesis